VEVRHRFRGEAYGGDISAEGEGGFEEKQSDVMMSGVCVERGMAVNLADTDRLSTGVEDPGSRNYVVISSARLSGMTI
jgi:hypothetical protein